MHLTPSDPDIATLKRKIDHNRLDLQPNFQRGEVWGKQKKQRLIDSILRGWHIPPIHVIQVPNSSKQEVLDGQQRLAAIRDFINDEFPIFGNQEPLDNEIQKLDGKYWSELNPNDRGRIEDFTIRILTISNYKIGEPGELFYRLNQPTNLTSAEQRNAYFGEARQQVKNIVKKVLDFGFSTETIGFSNSRMAYDDVMAKCLLTLEKGNLSFKMTSNAITARYRETRGFEMKQVERFDLSLKSFFNSQKKRKERTKLNKATLFSWLIFHYECKTSFGIDDIELEMFFNNFEQLKESISKDKVSTHLIPSGFISSFIETAIKIYTDRSSSRVADVSSVKLRNLILWGLFLSFNPSYSDKDAQLAKLLSGFYYLSSKSESIKEGDFLNIISDLKWEGKIA